MRITIDLNLSVEANQEQLLQGLEAWQTLGLLSPEQVKQLCEQYLSVPLPPVSVRDETPAIGTATDFVVPPSTPDRPKARVQPQVKPRTAATPSLVSRLLQSFVAELSVMWLLFLGVFLVVVSSGVLAATQWRNFSPSGQYSILLTYTLVFWGASVWIGQQERLQLTARMLAIATLLLIPINVWMMDGLRIAQSTVGLGIAAIASLLLTVMTIRLLRPTERWITINAIALSGLHWGWGWSGVPLIATYLGTLGTVICLLRSPLREPSNPITPDPPTHFPVAKIAIAFAVLLLIGRAIFMAQVPPSQLGLAFGLCGWLLIRLTRALPNGVIWGRVGAILLGIGWVVSIAEEPPWQAIAVSALALWLLWQRLRRQWQAGELAAFLFIGFQTFWLMWFLLPMPWRQSLLVAANAIAGPVDAWQLASLGGLVYVGLMLGFAMQLRRWQHPMLATQAEVMALGLGTMMVALSWAVPLVRSLALLMATLAWVAVLRDRPGERFGVYLTHATGLAACLSWISTLFPNLSETAGAAILLTLMGGEWLLSLVPMPMLWQKSAWYAGLVLAALAYPVLWSASPPMPWSLMGLAVPILLTGVAIHPAAYQPRIAAQLTVPALVLQMLLLDRLPPIVITLGIGTGLLLIHSRQQRSLIFAMLTVGFGLGCVSTWIYQAFSPQLTTRVVMILMAIALGLLWGLRGWLKQRPTPMHTLYAIATDSWAIGLCSLLLLFLTADVLSIYAGVEPITRQLIGAAGLTTAALGYRLWQQSTELGWWGLAWAVELWIASVLLTLQPTLTVTPLAIATLTLGFVAQLLGDWWIAVRRGDYPSSWHAIPLTYGVLGLLLSHSSYTETTGLYTLAAALIWVGVGRRQPALQPLTYLALAGVSIAFYELLIYQLLQAKGGNVGDGITLLAGLAILIAVGDRLLSRWLLPYLRLNSVGLQTVANGHWAIGSGLALLAWLSSRSDTGATLWMGVMAILAAYALAIANRYMPFFGTDAIHRVSSPTIHRASASPEMNSVPSPFTLHPSLEAWTYAGIIEGILLMTDALHRWLPDPQILWWWGGAIAAGVAFLLYPLPWERWGWSAQPWKRSMAVLPGAAIALTLGGVALQTLLIVGAFYAWLAKSSRRLRLSYISVVLLDWAVLRFLSDRAWLEPLWISTVIGGSMLYLVQIDPALQEQSDAPAGRRDRRHLLRLLATGLICLTALYQAEVELQPAAIVFALLTLALSIGLILLGILLRVRAFLYIGTVTFILRVLRLLWLFVSAYSALLWAVGIVLGLIFIWIAATFEARRSQVNSLMQTWTAELSAWE